MEGSAYRVLKEIARHLAMKNAIELFKIKDQNPYSGGGLTGSERKKYEEVFSQYLKSMME